MTKPFKIKLIERHRNGAFFEVKGDPEKIVPILLEWRTYQDGLTTPRAVAGFKIVEESE